MKQVTDYTKFGRVKTSFANTCLYVYLRQRELVKMKISINAFAIAIQTILKNDLKEFNSVEVITYVRE